MEKIALHSLFENDQIIWLEEEKLKREEGIVKSDEAIEKSEKKVSFHQNLLIFHAENGDYHDLFKKILSANPINLNEKHWILIHQHDLSYQDYMRKTQDQDKKILVMGIQENFSDKIQINQIMPLRNKRFLYLNQPIEPLQLGSISKEEKLQFWEKIKELLLIT